MASGAQPPANGGKQSSEGLDLKRYVVLLRENTITFCVVAVIITVLGTVVGYVLPKKYQASSTVSIEQNVISDLVKGIAITPSLEAKMRILKVSVLSRRMLLQVIRDLDMDLNTKGEALEQLIETTRSNVEIGHEEKKGLFYIRFTVAGNFIRLRHAPIHIHNHTGTCSPSHLRSDPGSINGKFFIEFRARIGEKSFPID